MLKITPILFTLLILSCGEDPKCDAVCEIAIADFEPLIKQIEFIKEEKSIRSEGGLIIFVERTSRGMLLHYSSWGRAESLTIELSDEEWRDFIRALYTCCMDTFVAFERCKRCKDRIINIANKGWEHSVNMSLSIHYLDKNHPDNLKFYYENELKTYMANLSSNWDDAEKIMEDFLAKIIKKYEFPVEKKLKAEYHKRFGEPITDIELSTNKITFSHKKFDKNIRIYRTKAGAVAYSHESKIELSISEWLDLVRTLRKVRIDKWKKNYSNSKKSYYEEWALDIYHSNKVDFIKAEGSKAYPSNFTALIKTIDDIESKIKQDPFGDELKNKLKSEYQKRFGEPISDLELSTNGVVLYIDLLQDKSSRNITSLIRERAIYLTRTATGVFVEYKPEIFIKYPKIKKIVRFPIKTEEAEEFPDAEFEDIEAELGIGEWLDFIRAFYKLQIDKWENGYGNDGYGNKPFRYWDLNIYNDTKNHIKHIYGYDYPPNWNEFKKLMDGMVDKARENSQ